MIDKTLIELLPLLCPPGSGVYTVFTGRDRRIALQKRLYACIDEAADAVWRDGWLSAFNHSGPLCLGLCSDNGGGIHRGANWGPLVLREALYQEIKDWNPIEVGDIRVIPQLLLDEYVAPELIRRCRQALYGSPDSPLPVSPLSMADYCLDKLYTVFPERFILGIGGDHASAYPFVTRYLQSRQTLGKRVAVIHFDAHTDLMPQRLGIPICFGSWVHHALPFLADPACWIQIGIRASGRPRYHWEHHYGIRQFWAHEILENGPEVVLDMIKAQLAPYDIDEWYLTFDIDALDAEIASATGTPEPDGLSLAICLSLLKGLKAYRPLGGMDVMEIAPFVNYGDGKGSASTLHAGVEIIRALHPLII